MVPGRPGQGRAGRQRPGAGHDGDPALRLRHLGADAGRGGRPHQGGGRRERLLPAVHPRELPADARPSTSRASAPSWRWSPWPAARSSRSRSSCGPPARPSSASSWPSGSRATATCRCCSTSGPTSCAGSCGPRLFLRTTEFLWQEGHTAHATEADAPAYALRILPRGLRGLHGQRAGDARDRRASRPRSERFAGAINTLTCEAMMRDGKALQMGTSHELGQNFARAFDIEFLDDDRQQQHVWTTSWGVVDAHGRRADHGPRRRRRPAGAARGSPTSRPSCCVVRDERGRGGVPRPHRRRAGGRRRPAQLDDRAGRSFGRRVTDWELKGVPGAARGRPARPGRGRGHARAPGQRSKAQTTLGTLTGAVGSRSSRPGDLLEEARAFRDARTVRART